LRSARIIPERLRENVAALASGARLGFSPEASAIPGSASSAPPGGAGGLVPGPVRSKPTCPGWEGL